MIASLVLPARPPNASCQCSGLQFFYCPRNAKMDSYLIGDPFYDTGYLRPALECASPCAPYPALFPC